MSNKTKTYISIILFIVKLAAGSNSGGTNGRRAGGRAIIAVFFVYMSASLAKMLLLVW